MVQSSFSSVVDVKIGGAKLPPEFAPDLVDSHVDQGWGCRPRSGSRSATPTGCCSAS